MNLQQKEQIVGQVGERFQESGAAFVVDYQGCSCSALTGLRNELRPTGSKFAVVKNTLVKRAISGTDVDELSKVLEGPTAVVWAGEDPVAPAKVLAKFAKDQESFSIKAGIVEGKVVDAAQVAQLATMPSREELYAKLLALMNAPATQLVQMLNAPASSLARLLGAWKSELEKQQ